MSMALRLSRILLQLLCSSWIIFGLTISSRRNRPGCFRVNALQMKISEGTASRAVKAFTPMQRLSSGPNPHVVVETWLHGIPDSSLEERAPVHLPTTASSADLAYCSSFEVVWNRQKALLAERSDALRALPGRGIVLGEVCPLDDYLILVQHAPVFTLGTSTQAADVAGLIPSTAASDDAMKGALETSYNRSLSNTSSSSGSFSVSSGASTPTSQSKTAVLPIDVVKVNRGGEATWHGPGQLVAYPVLDLRRYQKDAHWYLRALEEVGLRAATAATLHALDRAASEVKGSDHNSDAAASGTSAASTAIGSVKTSAAKSTRTEITDSDVYYPITNAAQLERRWGLRFGRVPGYTGVWCFSKLVDGTDVDSSENNPMRSPVPLEAQNQKRTSPSEHTEEFVEVWSKPVKVMATGVAVKRWVTQHGLALNCDCDLAWASPKAAKSSGSDRRCSLLDEVDGAANSPNNSGDDSHAHIVPCGISDMKVGSLSGVIVEAWKQLGCAGAPPSISVLNAAPHLLNAFEEVFGCECASDLRCL